MAATINVVILSLVIAAGWLPPANAQVTKSANPDANHQITKSPDRKIIKVSAERFAFTPSEIVVEQGTVIEFHLTSEDTDHGFRIIGTDVDVAIPKRRRGETIARYTADKAGRFVIECSRPCGAGHTAMRATLIVK
jgi:cytochrome c oxidase subunit 2